LLERKQTEIDTGIIQLESLLNNIVDKDFDKFEIYTLRNILAVGHEEESLARWVRLEHYKNLELDSSTTTITPEELLQQRRKVQETAKLNAMLKAEEARNQTVIAQLHTLTGQQPNNPQQPSEPTDQTCSPFSFLTSSPHTSATTQPLSQNLQYAIAQLPALRELLAQLKASLQSLPAARQTRLDENSLEAKRRGYINTQSRRALNKRGVVASGLGGEAVAGAGRRVAAEEVQGLESVVQALGGAGKSDDMGK
jgi:kinetochore protein Mis12/MTW1